MCLHSTSPWSTHVLPIEPEATEAWSSFFSPFLVFTAQTSASGRLFCVDRRWTVYTISLDNFDASPVETAGVNPLGDPSRCAHAVLFENDKFLVLLTDDHRTLYKFELDRGEWTTVNLEGPHPLKDVRATLTVCASNLYLFGGLLSQNFNELWRLDISSDQAAVWDPVELAPSNAPRPRMWHHFFSDGKNMFLYGGWDHRGPATDPWKYDPLKNTWTELPSIGSASAAISHHALLVDDAIFTLGDGSFPFSNLTALRLADVVGGGPNWFDLQHLSLARHGGFKSNALWENSVRFTASDTSRIFVFEKDRRRHGENIISIYVLHTRRLIDPNSGLPIISCLEGLDNSYKPPNPGAAKPRLELNAFSAIKSSITAKEYALIRIPTRPAGEGGFCDIFVGTHVPTGTRLALKRPRLSTLNEADILRRVRREVDIWSAFNHVNVLPFLGIMMLEIHAYLVSPWLEQGDLAVFVNDRVEYFRKGDVPRDSRHDAYHAFNERQVIKGIAAGIAYLHSRAFVHGDLKGKNVLLGEGNRPLLCDFGMTKALDSPSSVTSTAMKGVGTMRWKSPELFANESKTYQSDVYAFAMIISEVLTGSYPFPNLDDHAFLSQLVVKKIRPSFEPLSRNGIDFVPLWRIAESCWVEESRDRPLMDEVLDRLNTISVGTNKRN